MNFHIRPVQAADIDALAELSLLAWSPVFLSFENVLGREIYELIWPNWRDSQKKAVESICGDEKMTVRVAEADGIVVGFLAYELRLEEKTAEVQLLAVHPDYQNRGIGVELNRIALKEMRDRGMKLAIAETGGDPSHAPARKCYEKAGYTALPIARYFKDLSEL